MKFIFAVFMIIVAVATFLPNGSESAPRGGWQQQQPRGGRQGDNALADGGEEGPEHPWCDPTDPMGAWMNYVNVRKWCAENGYTNFGPYGGVPSEDEESE